MDRLPSERSYSSQPELGDFLDDEERRRRRRGLFGSELTPKPAEPPTEKAGWGETAKQTPEAVQEKRDVALEKSLALKGKYEAEPIPEDPHVIAQVIVAEQLVALQQELDEPTPESPDPEDILESIDFLAGLADKLEQPELEASDDIERSYEIIITFVEEGLENGETPDEIVGQNGHAAFTTQETIETEPIDEEVASPSKSKTKKSIMPLILPKLGAKLVKPVAVATAVAAYGITRMASGKHHEASLAVPANESDNTTYRNSLDSNPDIPQSMERPAADQGVPSQRAYEMGLAAAAMTSGLLLAGERPRATQTVEAEPQFEQPKRSVTAEQIFEVERHDSDTAINARKLEHVPLLTLLAMADHIPVGHGENLRSMFENDQIDKAGLIKILKLHKNGGDYIAEYRRQVEHYRIVKSSPEFLNGPTRNSAHIAAAMQQQKAQPEPDDEEQRRAPEPTQRRDIWKDLATSSRLAPPQKQKDKLNVWIVVSATGFVASGVALIFALIR